MYVYTASNYICSSCGDTMMQYRPKKGEPYMELMCGHGSRPWDKEEACRFYNVKVLVRMGQVEVEKAEG